MNIVFGGSFNPPTIAHFEIARTIIKKYDVENFIFLPVGTNYSHKDGLVNNEHRLAMLNILAQKLENTIVSSIEMQDDYKGTYYSLNKLSRKYNDLVFILGADNLIGFSKWLHFEKLIKKYKFMVIGRSHINVSDLIKESFNDYQDKFLIETFNYNNSSTSVRQDIEKEKKQLLPEIYEYIVKNSLYRRNENV